MKLVRRRTTCRVEGHGTRCEVAVEQYGRRWPRSMERQLALEYEELADDSEHVDGDAGLVAG